MTEIGDIGIAVIKRATAATCRQVAEWFDPREAALLLEVATAVERLSEDDICCPACEEVTCDDGCPLAPVRNRWADHPDYDQENWKP